MNDELFERLVLSFESIAQSLVGINETKQAEFAKRYPEQKVVREAIVTRLPNEEDKLLESQGIDGKPLEEWLQIPEDESEFIGEREREFIEEQKRNASSKVDGTRSGSGGVEAVGSDTAGTGERQADNPDIPGSARRVESGS